MPIQPVNPGDPIRAADFNALVEEVRQLRRLLDRGDRRAGGVASDVERIVLAYIVSAPPEGVPIMPGDCTYTYALFGNSNIEVSGVIPWKGRPVLSDGGEDGVGEIAVYPRPVGEACWIHRVRLPDGSIEARLEVVTEAIAFGPCTPSGGAGGGSAVGGGGDGPEDETPVPNADPIEPGSGGAVGGAGETTRG